MKGILMKPWKTKFIVEHPDMELQTRRVIKLSPDRWDYMRTNNDGRALFWLKSELASMKFGDPENLRLIKPRYPIGETVYIKEKYGVLGWFGKGVKVHNLLDKKGIDHDIIYPDENPDFEWHGESGGIEYRKDGYERSYWKSPMTMPEEFARYFITITGVRAERLQEIGIGDIGAEGIELARVPLPYDPLDPEALHNKSLLDEFALVWNSINKEKWEMNPWVFAYKFKFDRRR